MSLAPGTALQNGHYVIDALLEAAPNGDLYWGTHVVTGMQVFIQVFPVSADGSGNDLSSLVARLEGVAFAPQSPLPNPFQLFRGEDQTLCLAMGVAVGLPWSSVCKTRRSMTPKQALASIRQIADSVAWLKAQGISGLDLSPNRVWFTEASDRITLTGLPQAYWNLSYPLADNNDQPDTTSAQFLARLLYSFLMGELPTTYATADDLRTALNRKLPTLSPIIVQAICRGVQVPPPAEKALSLPQWLNQLPDAAQPHQLTQPGGQLALRQPPTGPTPQRPKLYTALAGTALLAAVAGISFGTFWRLNAKSLPGSIQFEPDQSFPSQAEWSGDEPEASFDTPFIPAQSNPLRREDWYDSELDTLPQESPWESPANAAEWPEDSIEEVDEPPIEPIEDAVGESVGDDPDEASETTTPPVERLPENDFPDGESVPQDFSPPPFETPGDENVSNFSNAVDLAPQKVSETETKAMPPTETLSKS